MRFSNNTILIKKNWKTISYICAMRWIVFLVIVFQVSCTIDELPSCEGLGEEGEICKEYQYIFGRYNGVNEYEYDINTGFLSQITTKRKNGSIEGVAQYSYNDLGFVSSIVFQDSKGQLLKEKSIYYNDLGDIDTEITIGESKVEYKYHYDGYVLNSSVLSINGEVEWVDSIEYFSGSDEMYRKLRYVNDGLSEITYYESFANNIKEERVTNVDGEMLYRKVIHFNENKYKLEELIYSKQNILLDRVVFYYFDEELDRIEKYNDSGEKYEELNYQRY